MNTSSKCRNGTRNLNQGLNRTLDHGCSRFCATMLGGARRPRQPDLLAVACGLISRYLRLAGRMAKQDPHLFGPHARRYFLDTLQREAEEQEIEIALRKVYGPPAPGQPAHVSTLWTDRYFPQPKQRRLFLKWFHEQYP